MGARPSVDLSLPSGNGIGDLLGIHAHRTASQNVPSAWDLRMPPTAGIGH